MSAPQRNIYRFERFELDPGERRLLSAGQPIALTPKVFDTLVLLVQRAGHVVSKEEIIQAIWPRGFVDESNLTKHIWLIRRALGEGEHPWHFIETVPKLGYRFVAPVAIGTEPPRSDSAPPRDLDRADARPATHSRRISGVPGRLALGLAAMIALGVWVAWYLRPMSAARAGHEGHTVAFMGFRNLSGNSKDAWVAPALTELLSAELYASADLRVIPDELVRDASAELSPPAASGYSRATLERIVRRLDADFVVSGSYLVGNASADSPLRVELAVQDAQSGALLAARTFDSDIAQLNSLVGDAGALLRDQLARTATDRRALGLIARSQPPSIEVARRVGFALDALQHYDAARARDELLEAIAEAPGYPLAYMRLAQAWTALGYRDKAIAAAEQAARYAVDLTPEQRLQADATVAMARSDWSRAAGIWQSLVKLRPSSPEYRLQSIEAQINASRIGEAQKSLVELRALAQSAGDPRVEIAAAHLARELDDIRGESEHAQRALEQARARESPGLIADAELELAQTRQRLGDLSQARSLLDAAAKDYRGIRNPRGEARVYVVLAALLATDHHAQEAREEIQRAMSLYQSIGDQGGIAEVYRGICDMLWTTGDRDGAQIAAREGLRLARETGDVHLQTWTLRALATIASDESAGDEVLDAYREVLALNEKNGDRGGEAWSLASIADVQRLRGALKEAKETCKQAKAEAAQLTDPQFSIYSVFTCALVAVDMGDSEDARAALNQVMQQASATRYPAYADNARLTLAQLDMDEKHWSAARDKLRGASRGFESADIQTGEADAMALLALCDQALGDRAQGQQAAARARKLRESITARQEVYLVDIALAQLEATRGNDVDKLLKLASDAQQRHFEAWAEEARLAAWQILRARGGGGSADSLRAELERDAQRRGFGRVLNLLQADSRNPT